MNKIVKWGVMENGEAAIRRLISGPSWFRAHPHYGASTSLLFACAMACAAVLSKMLRKASYSLG